MNPQDRSRRSFVCQAWGASSLCKMITACVCWGRGAVLAGACGHVQRMFSLLRQRPPLHCTFVTVCVLMALLLRCVKVRVMLPGTRTMLGDAAAEAELFATEEFVTVSSSSSRTAQPLGRCLTELIHRFGRLAGCQAPSPPARPAGPRGMPKATSRHVSLDCRVVFYHAVPHGHSSYRSIWAGWQVWPMRSGCSETSATGTGCSATQRTSRGAGATHRLQLKVCCRHAAG